jgi:predicted enzyme related to lactoylglutathione lyase
MPTPSPRSATIVVPPMDIPNVGRFAILVDPQGVALGVLQPS